MNAKNAMFCWNPGTDQAAVIPLPDHGRLSKQYRISTLGCFTNVQKMPFPIRKDAIIRDRVDPDAVHNALLNLQEYRDGCSDDMPGI